MSGFRAHHKNTMATLGEPHTLPTLTIPFLFCLLVGMAIYLVSRLGYILALFYLPQATAELLRLTAISVFEVLMVVAVLLPLWLGRLRMAGLLLSDKTPLYGDCFYFFKERARYCRTLCASAMLALVYGLAGLAVYGAFAGVIALYRSVLFFYFADYAFLALVALLHVALAVTVGVIYLAGLFLPFAALVVGNEDVPLGVLFIRAVKSGRKNIGKNFLFALKQLLWLALCLVSLMVLYVMWYSHYFNLFYLRYSMEVTQ